MDQPDRGLKPHVRAVPYLGGAAICLGWTAALAVAGLGDNQQIDWRVLLPILLGGIAMSALGLLDDLRDMPPKARIAIGAAIIVVVMLFTGVADRLTESFLRYLHIQLPPVVAVTISFLLGLFIVLGACNSTNLIDGLDGLCAGVTAIISLGFFVLAAYLAIVQYSREANAIRLALAVAMFGATLGFLPLNFNPAKIFMGDAGSVLLGYNCGIMILLFDERGQLRWMLAGLMIFALPIFDTALAIVRRWRSGRSIFVGDRSHFYDQLVDRGISVRKVVLISYLLAAFYAALGCSAIWLRLRYILPLYAVVALATAIAIHMTGMARAEPTPAPQPQSSDGDPAD
jgi:UDP-GlcNAc:undecaprenyl-phosphate GlcNAc-1-phosphate transferase